MRAATEASPRRDPSAAPVRARGLDRAVEIFQLLHAVRKPIPIGEIARRLKAPRSTIYEIVNLFLAADILEYAGDGSEVFFGRAIYLYANDYFATHALLRLGQEEVRRLAALDRRDLPVLHAGREQVRGRRRCRTARGFSASAPTSACSCRFRGRPPGAFRRAYEPRRAEGLHPARGFPHAERQERRPANNSSPRRRQRASAASAPSPDSSTITRPASPRRWSTDAGRMRRLHLLHRLEQQRPGSYPGTHSAAEGIGAEAVPCGEELGGYRPRRCGGTFQVATEPARPFQSQIIELC